MPRPPDADPVAPTFGNGRATEKLRDRSPSGPTDAIPSRSLPAGPRASARRRATREQHRGRDPNRCSSREAQARSLSSGAPKRGSSAYATLASAGRHRRSCISSDAGVSSASANTTASARENQVSATTMRRCASPPRCRELDSRSTSAPSPLLGSCCGVSRRRRASARTEIATEPGRTQPRRVVDQRCLAIRVRNGVTVLRKVLRSGVAVRGSPWSSVGSWTRRGVGIRDACRKRRAPARTKGKLDVWNP
jgi:hypothetical protein